MDRRVYCMNCGSYNPDEATYCMKCGVSLNGRGQLQDTYAREIGRQLLSRARKVLFKNPAPPMSDDVIAQERVSADAFILLVINSLRVTGILLVLGLIMTAVHIVAGSIVVGLYILALAFTTYLTCKNYFFSVDENNFEQHYGILQKKSVTIPFYQIQNVNINRTPLDQMLGLARLEIETAGRGHRSTHQFVGGSMSSAEACLMGLTLERAKEVCDLVLKKAAETKKDELGP